jgi:bacterioferritin-associated ferredoxin
MQNRPEDSTIVCYCHRLTVRDLTEEHRRAGSLAGVQTATRAGTGCGGCRALLESMFGQAPLEINQLDAGGIAGATACVKPGERVMKSFIVADNQLESRVYSSNAVPPQLGNCDSTTPVEYTLLNSHGKAVLRRQVTVQTNETFLFDTRREQLHRPFYGMFLYSLGRSNYGASRFNVAWAGSRSVTSSHENASTGRPDVVLPILVDHNFLNGPNTVYLALQNPHARPLRVLLRVFDVHTGEVFEPAPERAAGGALQSLLRIFAMIQDGGRESGCLLPPGGTVWVNASQDLYTPALRHRPESTVALRIYSPEMDTHRAPTIYFFLHNRTTDLWGSNHM